MAGGYKLLFMASFSIAYTGDQWAGVESGESFSIWRGACGCVWWGMDAGRVVIP